MYHFTSLSAQNNLHISRSHQKATTSLVTELHRALALNSDVTKSELIEPWYRCWFAVPQDREANGSHCTEWRCWAEQHCLHQVHLRNTSCLQEHCGTSGEPTTATCVLQALFKNRSIPQMPLYCDAQKWLDSSWKQEGWEDDLSATTTTTFEKNSVYHT